MVGLTVAGGGIVEGVYNTWSYKWSWSLPNGINYWPEGPAFYIDEVNNLFYLWWLADSPEKTRFGTFNITDHSTIFISSPNSNYTVDNPIIGGYGDGTFFLGCHGLAESILRSHQTYMLLNRPGYFTIEVWKAGNRLWTRDLRSDTGEAWAQPTATEISLTGKYIMLFDDETQKLLLYEGS